MDTVNYWRVNPGWRLLLIDLGLDPLKVLDQGNLPPNLFTRKNALLSTSQYYRLWHGLQQTCADPALALRIGAAFQPKTFSPIFLAALCSPNLNTAIDRLSKYTRLLCPMTHRIHIGAEQTVLDIDWPSAGGEVPELLKSTTLVMFVCLTRVATRENVCPVEVLSNFCFEPELEYTRFFGVKPLFGPHTRIVFKHRDCILPFLTFDRHLWGIIEPQLQQSLAGLDPLTAFLTRPFSQDSVDRSLDNNTN